ncbi:MAG: PAS domain S-box protein, partial [Oligoflexia bacterium]|nr:PAS domain S-box protein [Oligoflexia bacterium]
TRSLFGILVASLAAGLQWYLWPWVGPSRFILFYPATIVAALIGGLHAGVAATLVGGLHAIYFFFPPVLNFRLEEPNAAVAVGCFVASGLAVAMVSEGLIRRSVRLRAMEHERADVRERQRILEESERRFRQVFDASPNALLAIAADGVIQFVNPQVEKVFGFRPEELVGQKIEILVPENIRNRHVGLREGFMQAPRARRLGMGRDLLGRRKDGSAVPVEIALTPIEVEQKIVILTTVTDVTERRRTEERLRESEEVFRTVFNSTYDGVLLHSRDGKIREVNERCLQMYRMTREEMLRCTVSEISSPASRVSDLPEIWEGVLRGEDKFFEWHARRPPDGFEFDVEVFLRRIRIQGTELVLANIRDITERKKYERELRDALVLRDEFLSIASHELKTPLTSLSMRVQMRKRYSPSPEERASLEAEERQILRLNRLVDEMLDVSRIASGQLSLHIERFDLGEFVAEVVERFRVNCSQSGVTLHLQERERVEGVWDRERLEQVLMNLLSNALKYGEGKPITVGVRPSGVGAEFWVRDEGRGISMDDQARIFDRFERAVEGSKISGLGLGLYIAKRIVDLHGGVIRVESEEGRGAKFRVELPLRS